MVEANDTLSVTDGTVTEDCTVLETWTHYGTEVAEVSGPTINGFVEVVPSEVGTIDSDGTPSEEVGA